MKKVHILQSFPGASKGKTKDLDDATANELIAEGHAVVATDKSKHPEPSEDAEMGKPGADRQTKTDKTAEGADNK